MKYTYEVYCWVKPHTGFDLATKNDIFTKIKKESTPSIRRAVSKFEKKGEGLVIKVFIVESDSIIINAKRHLLPVIKKSSPEAEIIDWKLEDAASPYNYKKLKGVCGE